jgi:hypothetical protein
MRYDMPLVKRFLSKLVFDVMPAGLASLVGGLLLAHYGLNQPPETTAVQAVQVSSASAEMMQLLRDEHGLVVDLLKAHTENEKKQHEAQDLAARLAARESAANDAPAAAEQPPTATPPGPARQAVAGVAPPKLSAPRSRPQVIAVSLPAAVPPAALPAVPQTESAKTESAKPVSDKPVNDKPASEQNWLFARTVGVTDHVVAVTQRAVSALGGIPSWIGSIGDRIGGDGTAPRPPASLVSSS